MLAAVTLYSPQLRARWIPAYAADRSPLTMWAPEGKSGEYLIYDFGSRLKSKVLIQHIVIQWGEAYAKMYRIEASNDGEDWRTIHDAASGKGGIEVINLPRPVKARMVRLWLQVPGGKSGFSVVNFSLHGPEERETLPEVKGLRAEARANDKVELSWSRTDGKDVWLYRLHRSFGKPNQRRNTQHIDNGDDHPDQDPELLDALLT